MQLSLQDCLILHLDDDGSFCHVADDLRHYFRILETRTDDGWILVIVPSGDLFGNLEIIGKGRSPEKARQNAKRIFDKRYVHYRILIPGAKL